MSIPKPAFTIGIEEEYLIVDKETRNLISEPPSTLIQECSEALGGKASPEFLQSQLEVGTSVCKNVQEAGKELASMRKHIAEICNKYNLAPLAVSTHPFATWKKQKHTNLERYNALEKDYQGLVRRLMISGMHVHVGIDEEDMRIDLLNQATYFLPHLLALSTSSPFWQGTNTGLMSYRLAVWDEIPRTGLPEYFDSYAEYMRYVSTLVDANVIEDGTKVWWDLRPSARYPTVELRILDNCPLIEDCICIAAIYTCLMHMLYRLRKKNQRWRLYTPRLIGENRWRAQRYGVTDGLIDFGRGCVVSYKDLLDEIMEYVEEDAQELGYVNEIKHAYKILERGTGAQRQLAIYNKEKENGKSHEEALKSVVDMLINETVSGLDIYE